MQIHSKPVDILKMQKFWQPVNCFAYIGQTITIEMLDTRKAIMGGKIYSLV